MQEYINNCVTLSPMEMRIEAFNDNGNIPQEYTCDGTDTIPTIAVFDTPKETVSFALTVDDPDATFGGVWNHCVVYNIPPGVQGIHKDNLETFSSGINSWGNKWYGGPCPPKGSKPHRYVFTLYALTKELHFEDPPTSMNLLHAAKECTAQKFVYTGLYERV